MRVGCRFQYSLAKLSGICGPIQRDGSTNVPLKSEMIGLIVDKTLADVATNCYWRTCFGRGLLKYLSDTAAATIATRQFSMDKYFNCLLCNPLTNRVTEC